MFSERDQELIEARARLAGARVAGDEPVSTKLFDVPFPRADLTNNFVRVVDDSGMLATAIFDDPSRSFGSRIGGRTTSRTAPVRAKIKIMAS
jgi:hypothetical protein